MSEPIEAGDLVLCVRPPECCGALEALGGPYEVHAIRPIMPGGYCIFCGAIGRAQTGLELLIGGGFGMGWIERHRVKKIPPLTDEELAREAAQLGADKFSSSRREQQRKKEKLPQ